MEVNSTGYLLSCSTYHSDNKKISLFPSIISKWSNIKLLIGNFVLPGPQRWIALAIDFLTSLSVHVKIHYSLVGYMLLIFTYGVYTYNIHRILQGGLSVWYNNIHKLVVLIIDEWGSKEVRFLIQTNRRGNTIQTDFPWCVMFILSIQRLHSHLLTTYS